MKLEIYLFGFNETFINQGLTAKCVEAGRKCWIIWRLPAKG